LYIVSLSTNLQGITLTEGVHIEHFVSISQEILIKGPQYVVGIDFLFFLYYPLNANTPKG